MDQTKCTKDAGFGNDVIFNMVHAWESLPTLFFSPTIHSDVWGVLSHGFSTNQWHSAVHTSGKIAFCHAIITKKRKHAFQHVMLIA